MQLHRLLRVADDGPSVEERFHDRRITADIEWAALGNAVVVGEQPPRLVPGEVHRCATGTANTTATWTALIPTSLVWYRLLAVDSNSAHKTWTEFRHGGSVHKFVPTMW